MRLWLGVAVTIALALVAAGVVTGQKAQADPEYRIILGNAPKIEVGARGAQTLTITPLRGRRISGDGPLSIAVVVDPPTGLTLPRPRLRLRDAVDPKAEAPRFEIQLAGEKAGTYQLEIDIRFWICAKRTCRPVRERRRVTAEVVAPPPPPPTDAGPD